MAAGAVVRRVSERRGRAAELAGVADTPAALAKGGDDPGNNFTAR